MPLDYITTGDNREALRIVLTDADTKMAMCATHQLGITTNKTTKINIEIPKGEVINFQ